MSRSTCAAALIALAVLALAGHPVSAADPEPEAFVEALTDTGHACTEAAGPAGDTIEWHCELESAEFALFGQVLQGEIFGQATLTVGSDLSMFETGSTLPFPAEVVELWHRLIDTAMGDSPAAHDWLEGAVSTLAVSNDSQTDEHSLGDWSLHWQTYCDSEQCFRYASLTIQHSGSSSEPTEPAPVACLEADVIAAIERLDSGAVPIDPAEIADVLDGLELEGTADEARDGLVRNLRVPPEDEIDLVLAASIFQSEVAMQECGPEGGGLVRYLASYGLTCTDAGGGTECILELTDDQGLDATYSVVTRTDAAGEVTSIDAVVTSLDESMPSDAGGFLRGVAERAPVDDTADLVEWFDAAIGEPDSDPYEAGDWAAAWADTAVGDGRAWALSIARAGALESPAQSEGAAPFAPGEPGSGSISPDANVERPFAESVPAADEVSTDPIVILQSAALAALLVLLMPFPSQLFNSTLEAHEDEVRGWLRLDRIGSAVGRLGAFWKSWPGAAVFIVLAALLYGFLDPGFGLEIGSLATFLGMLLGIVLVTVAFAVPVVAAHRRIGDRWSLKVVPISLLVGVVCVLLSRLTGFQPGYLYGLLIGLAFARELSAADEGRATALGAVIMLAVALAAWLGLGALPESDAFGVVVLRTSLAALMVAGLEGVVFGLLPMQFLPGEPLYGWNRFLWGILLGIGAFAFFHILINPASGYLSDTSRTPLFTIVALLVGFSLVSVGFWAWFRFRDPAHGAERGA